MFDPLSARANPAGIIPGIFALGAIVGLASQGVSGPTVLIVGGLVWIGMALYLLPALLAFNRASSSRWYILAFNLGFGWTFLGWIGCLLWAVLDSKESPE